MPAFYISGSSFLSLPYHRFTKKGHIYEGSLAGLIGWSRYGGGLDALWTFPLFYRDDELFLSLPYCQWGSGWTAGLGLAGATESSHWVCPLYYADNSNLFSLLCCWNRNSSTGNASLFLPWALSAVEWTRNGDVPSWRALLLLGGKETDSAGHSYDWLLPFYYRNHTGVFSLPYGRYVRNGTENTWWATPLFGTRKGRTDGSWLFPLYSYDSDSDFDSVKRKMSASRLPDDLHYKTYVVTNAAGKAQQVSRPVVGNQTDKSCITLLGHRSETLFDGWSGQQRKWYHLKDRTSNGSYILWGHRTLDESVFNAETRERVGERHQADSHVLIILYSHSESSDTIRQTNRSYTSVLWRLWKRHEENGNVSLDVFPGFSHDTKADGRSQTSFLWKLIRYENDPKSGSHLDLFFIPVW